MEKDIIEKARNGDKNAFALIFSEDYTKQLYVMSRAKLGNEEDAKDVVQETILEAYKNISRLRDITKFKYWVNRILINKCNDIYRDRERANISFDEYVQTLNTQYKYDENLYDDYIYVDDDIDLYTMIEFLRPEEKDIIIMYITGYTSKEISIIMKKNENTIRTKIMRIKSKLKAKYGRGDV